MSDHEPETLHGLAADTMVLVSGLGRSGAGPADLGNGYGAGYGHGSGSGDG